MKLQIKYNIICCIDSISPNTVNEIGEKEKPLTLLDHVCVVPVYHTLLHNRG